MIKLFSHLYCLLPGGLAGAILGFKSQLFFVSMVEWDKPELRLLLGTIAGFILGSLITLVLSYITNLVKKKGMVNAAFLVGLSFLGLTCVIWFFWEKLAGNGLLWLAPTCLFAMMLCNDRTLYLGGWLFSGVFFAAYILWGQLEIGEPIWLISLISMASIFLFSLWARLNIEEDVEVKKSDLIPYLLALTIFVGLCLRLSGLDHGLPNFIAHCDTPKQLELVPRFLQGNIVPPTSYPVGHIYFYSALISQLQELATQGSPLGNWVTGLFGWMNFVVAMRILQVLMGAAIPLFVFFIAKRLWNNYTALLAAFLVAIDPIQITYSRQAMGEIPQTFWVFLSLLFAIRAFQQGRWLDYAIAGIAAGISTATKMYGGYILVASLLAWFMCRPCSFKFIVVLVLGLLVGIFIFSPYLWIDPQGWWNNILEESIRQYNVGSESNRLVGFKYFFSGLFHRFSLLWMLFSLGGIALLIWRRRKEDIFYLFVLFASLILIFGFRLRYLREWDFVNLTPFFSITIAVPLCYLATTFRDVKWARAAIIIITSCWLVSRVLIGFGDAYIAKVASTLEVGKAWVSRHLDPSEKIVGKFDITGSKKWLPEYSWSKSSYLPKDCLSKNLVEADFNNAKILTYERIWWDDPLPVKPLKPIEIFSTLNYYWENPEISFYIPQVSDFSSHVILPHNRVILPQPAFLRTPWSYSRPTDLIWGEYFPNHLRRTSEKLLFSDYPLTDIAYLALGRSSTRLYIAPETSHTFKVDSGKLNVGFFRPWRSVFPLYPRNYKILATHKNPKSVCWLGIFPQTETAAPMLARYGKWQDIVKATDKGLERSDPTLPAEALLFRAAALAKTGNAKGASEIMAKLKSSYPNFISSYRGLALGPEKESQKFLNSLTTANQTLLRGEQVSWSLNGMPDHAPGEQGWGDVAYLSADDHFHVWLPYAFLPGFLKVQVDFGFAQKPEEGKTRLRVIGHYPDLFIKTLAEVELDSSKRRAEVPFEVPYGPIRLELKLMSNAKSHPKITKIWITPDLRSEFKWRWKLLSLYLPELR